MSAGLPLQPGQHRVCTCFFSRAKKKKKERKEKEKEKVAPEADNDVVLLYVFDPLAQLVVATHLELFVYV